MKAARAAWEVTAGLIPGNPDPEFTKVWGYTSDDAEQDRARPEDDDTPPIFEQRMKEAYEYAMSLNYPSRLNWVRVDWIWF